MRLCMCVYMCKDATTGLQHIQSATVSQKKTKRRMEGKFWKHFGNLIFFLCTRLTRIWLIAAGAIEFFISEKMPICLL